MTLISTLTVASALIAATFAAPTVQSRSPTDDNNFALVIADGMFDINYLQTFKVSYVNQSAYIGQVKYQADSEPLIVGGAGVNGASNGLTFQSIHQTQNGQQGAFIYPGQTLPIGFSTPHGTAPAGTVSTNFGFSDSGSLLHNGRSLFYACQDANLAAISSYQIWWWGNGAPNGPVCKGPLTIQQADGCSRS